MSSLNSEAATGRLYRLLMVCVVVPILLLSSPVSASIIVTFDDADSFDGDGVGDSSAAFVDLDTGTSATLTTRGLVSGGSLNSNSGALGIDVTGDTSNTGPEFFNLGESWTFDLDVDAVWEGISFTFFNQTETFTVSSTDFVGLTLTPDPEVTYNSSLGAFTFATSGGDSFTFVELGAIAGLELSAGSDFTISFGDSGSRSGNAKLNSITFGDLTPVPEPSSVALMSLLLLGGVVAVRFRRKTVSSVSA